MNFKHLQVSADYDHKREPVPRIWKHDCRIIWSGSINLFVSQVESPKLILDLIFTLPTISVVFHHCKYFDYCLLKLSSWLELKGTTFICLSSYPTTTHPAAESPDSPLQVQLLTQGTPTISWTTQESHMQPYNKHNSSAFLIRQ